MSSWESHQLAKTTNTKKSSISINVDFDRPGQQFGYLRIIHSGTKTSGSVIPYPLTVISKGKGSTAVIASRLIRALDPDRVVGRIILMAELNYLAV